MSKNVPFVDAYGEPIYFPARLETLALATAEISSRLTMVSNFDGLVETATRLIQQSLGYDQVILYLADADQQQFTQKVTATVNHGQAIRSYFLEEDSLAHRALRYNCVIRVDDLASEAPNFYQANPLDIRSELHIPLLRGSTVIGILSFGSGVRYSFSEDDSVLILKSLAAQVAVLIDRLRWQISQRSKPTDRDSIVLSANNSIFSEESALQNILPGIQILSGIREVLDNIVKGVVEGLGYAGAMLAVLDEKNQTLPVQAVAFSQPLQWLNLMEKVENILNIKAIGSSASLINDQENLGVQSCLTGEVKITHDLYDLLRPVVSQDLSQWLQKMSKVKTCVSLPLLVKDRVVGNIFVGTTKRKFSKEDLDALQFFVTNAAIAIQNVMLFEKVSQELTLREAELTQLRGIEKMISSSLDLHIVLRRILHGALELTRAEYGHVVLAGKYASGLVYRVSYPERPASMKEDNFGITQWIMRHKKPKLVEDLNLVKWGNEDLKSIVANEKGAESELRSLLGVPITLEGELIGAINIASHKVKAFDEQALEMLERLAVHAAIAIRNAYQFKVEREMQKRLANIGQVAAMGDMASNMVHRINNWVGAIRADLKYLRRQWDQNRFDSGETGELLDDMLANAEATLTMADDIRKPFQSLHREQIDVNECIMNVLRDKAEQISELVVFKELSKHLPPVLATQQLELVFDNLITNALQSIEQEIAEKRAETGSQSKPAPSQYILRVSTYLSDDKEWIEIIVQDTGPGLSNQLNEIDIFKLGVSGREDGMGYGLWWCDTFLKRWGGDIQLINKATKGCKFLVRLPVFKI